MNLYAPCVDVGALSRFVMQKVYGVLTNGAELSTA